MARLRPVQGRPRRLVVYVRQSVERDGSISPEVQERACRDYLLSRGDEVLEVIADVGVSGLKWDRRPGVQRAMRMVADGRADGIIVWRWSRLSRSRLHQALALDAVEQVGGVIESATEPFDTATAGGRFGRDVMLAAAAFESQQKAEQWADAHQRRLDRGLPASGGPRLGYLLGPDRQYVPDPETAPIVAELYCRYLAGVGLEALAGWLDTLGVRSPKTGRRWTKRGVGYFMRAGFAAGLLQVGGDHRPGAHPPIIDEMVWARYRAEHQRRVVTAPRLLHPTTRLAGILRCAGCGYSMTLHYSTAQSVRYRCSARSCEAPAAVRVSVAEAAAGEFLATMAREVDRESAVAPASSQVLRDRLARQVARADAALTRLTVDLAREQIPDAAYRAARDELLGERATAESELHALAAGDQSRAGAPVAAAGLLQVWDAATPVEVNSVVRDLLQGRVFRGPRVVFRPAWEQAVDWEPS